MLTLDAVVELVNCCRCETAPVKKRRRSEGLVCGRKREMRLDSEALCQRVWKKELQYEVCKSEMAVVIADFKNSMTAKGEHVLSARN